MQNFTQEKLTPSQKTIDFLKKFARIYAPSFPLAPCC